ncbi:chitinase A1 [Nannizzia gypsea CBS 118893]|uniref:chitinase n=1 Tax=Arthroderma gypseum (strain ATCC MYA-4604 / CBS 118893) TaxID=535722 RepID=E4UZ05_ARTGP|nr:chitinase A1 [Nannizzia gypsea CBS 118893]EFR03335.1 chitinase A1 [Nannizzia gypsea CBS 118893]
MYHSFFSFNAFAKVFIVLVSLLSIVFGQQGFDCDTENPCKVGCCSKSGSCGFGPDWCSPENCIGTCDAVAECGKYAAIPDSECPLNVCCSQWGFCGTTEEFCQVSSAPGKGCQSNCGKPDRKKCSANWTKRRIAYYETWADTRECDPFRPEDIPVKALTHLNIAFGGIKDSKISIDDSEMISRIVNLKRRNRSLKVFIAVGGWAFSDPGPTRTAWSDMAADRNSRGTFASSVVDLLETYGLDGIDLDWEYPVADDRGGSPDDFLNLFHLVAALRKAFNSHNPAWGISMAIPASYWYLQHFNLASLQGQVSWFNLMSYDIHGKWDRDNKYTGPYVLGHTNVTEIQDGLDLLRRVDVDLQKVNLGIGFYGRSFTLADPKCNTPGCIFRDAGTRGECSGEPGILTFKEIMARQKRLNEKTIHYDEEAGVKYMVYDETQWVTYDDAESFGKKREILDNDCLGGVMIWAIDQDTNDFQALSGLLGDDFVSGSLLEGGSLSDDEKAGLASDLGGLTGDGCYVTFGCAGEDGHGRLSKCNPGDIPVARVHSPREADINLYGLLSHEASYCPKGKWKTVCCSAKSPATNCEWVGQPHRDWKPCTGGKGTDTCGPSRYELITDTAITETGEKFCSSGARSLCCDAAPDLEQCHWTHCTQFGNCPLGEKRIAIRGDKEGGASCRDGEWQNFCCATKGNPEVEPSRLEDGVTVIKFPTAQMCSITRCKSTQVTFGKSMLPERTGGSPSPCGYFYEGIQHRLCCDPLAELDLPFDVKKIFPHPIGDDVIYHYSDNYGNNDRDPNGPGETDVGDDPYGFIVLDGDQDALQGNFPRDFVFVHKDDGTGNPLRRRETLTRDDPDLMSWVFEHEESEHLVYCRNGRGQHCEKIFSGGAADTIIGLPRHIGSGPYARVVSMEPVDNSELPKYHIRKRSAEAHNSTVYKLLFDYNFQAIRRSDSRVNIRIDYTNLVPYWDEMTGKESETGSMERRALRHEKRWWGGYTEWIEKLSKVRASDEGKLPLSIHKRMLLYRRRAQCARGNTVLKAGLDVTLDAKFDMNARWAYYAEGTIIPLAIDNVYTYFELEPEAQAIIEIDGSAEMEYKSQRIKIIDTLSYPGLAIKGIAAIGPTLDIYGSMAAGAKLAGTLKAGGKIKFPKYELYFPQTEDAERYQKFPTPREEDEQRAGGVDTIPILDASVEANVHVDFIITPEVNLGIKVNAPSIKGPVLDAQIVAFVNNTMRFEVQANANGGIEQPPAASYSIFIKYFYNFGEHSICPILSTLYFPLTQNLGYARTIWPGLGRQIVLFEHHGSTAVSKRNTLTLDSYETDRFMPLYSSNSTTRRLSKRGEGPAEVPSFGNSLKSFFNCNDKGQCSTGGCNGDACDWNPSKQSSLSKRDDTNNDDEDPVDVDPVQNCVNSIPAMMYNCKWFPDEHTGSGVFPGICRNILQYFTDNGLGSGPLQATFSNIGSSTEGANRNFACGSRSWHSYEINDPNTNNLITVTETWSQRCARQSNTFADLSQKPHGKPGNKNWFSCDEFPFNSLKEGGAGAQVDCVPGYQQEMQSNLNKLPRGLEQEVTWTDSQGQTRTAFKLWSKDWQASAAVGTRRDPNKDTAWNWELNNEKSFTFHLFNSDSLTTTTGGTYEVFNHKLKDVASGKNPTDDINIVVAAMNTFDNKKYRMPGANAWCHNVGNPFRNHELWGNAGGRFIRIVE